VGIDSSDRAAANARLGAEFWPVPARLHGIDPVGGLTILLN